MPDIFFQEIRLFPTPNQRQRVVLGGTEYVLEFRWRQRTKGWYVSIFDSDENPIIKGRRLRESMNAIEPADDIDGYLGGFGPDFPDYQDAEDFSVIYGYADNS